MSRRRKPPVGNADAWWKTGRGKEYYEYALKDMPPGAIKANLSKHAQHNSYGPPLWYVDQRRKCRDCGKEFLFSAKEQQHWYEIVRLPIQVSAVHCPACRKKIRHAKAAQRRHMEEMSRRPMHPNRTLLKSTRKKAKT